MPKLASTAEMPAPAAGKQVIEKKETITTDIPHGEIPRPGTPGKKPKLISMNEWFATLAPDERAKDYSYTLYRDDKRIVIVEENLDDRASGKMLYKFSDDEIRTWPEGPFLQELSQWVKDKGYGGGDYHIMITRRKASRLMYNKGFCIDGEPILSSREEWRDGRGPAYSGSEGSSVLPVVLRITDDINKKLDAVASGRADAGQSVAAITKTIMESNTQAVQWLIANMPKPEDPLKQLEVMRNVFEMFRQQQTESPKETALGQMMQLAEVIKAVRSLDERPALPATVPTVPAPPEGASLKEIVREAVVAATAGKARDAGTDWGQFFSSAISSPAVGNLLMAGAAWLRSKIATRQPQPAPVTVNQPGRQRTPFRPASPQTPPGSPTGGFRMQPRPMNSHDPIQPQTPQEEHIDETAAERVPTEQIEIDPQAAQAVLFEHVARQFIDLFKSDEPGDTVAGALDRMFPQVAQQMRFMNESMLKGFISSHHILAEIKDDARLPQFLAEFVGYFKQADTPTGD